MNELVNSPCPPCCPCSALLEVVASIAHEEDALACLLNAECARITKIISLTDEIETLIAVSNYLQPVLEQLLSFEHLLKDKLDSVLPLIQEKA